MSKCPFCGEDTCGLLPPKVGNTYFLQEGIEDAEGAIKPTGVGLKVDVYACSSCKRLYFSDPTVYMMRKE